ncbi:MAG: Ig-like domain-containing protein [Treponema sp.]|nr:Ig-like domain-containing protein [Treponema sp.]
MNKKLYIPVLFLLAVVILVFSTCIETLEEPKEDPFEDNTLWWTFQQPIPGWKPFIDEPGFRDDYPGNPNGTTMRLDAEYIHGMTLQPATANRTIRWVPDYASPPDSGFTDGFIQSNGATPAGNHFLKIDNVQGPFLLSLNYTAREPHESSAVPVIFINGEEVHTGIGTNGWTPLFTDYEYSGDDIVTIQMANNNGPIRIYDIIISPLGSVQNDVPAGNVSINVKDFSLAINDTRQLTANVLPRTATNKNIQWSSSNTNVAIVNSTGLITAVSPGIAVITATASDGSGKKDNITVTVKSLAVPMTTPNEIFEAFRGMKATTSGWADMANNGAGITYTNPADFILINDALYPIPIDKRKAFTDALALHTEKFIVISGDIDLSDGKIWDVPGGSPGAGKEYFNQFGPAPNYNRINGDITFNIGSNTTLIGINNARIMFGGLIIRGGANNIIIRNVTFWDAHGSTAQNTEFFPDSKASATALQIENNPGGSNIWVDHCKFTDGTCVDLVRNYNHDGAFDIKYGRFITVSWTEFTNHDKVMLVGSNDNTSGIITYLNPTERQITLHHNYFHGVTQRMPRTRGTQMHVYNNYYNNIGTTGNGGSFMGPGYNAQFIVENNYFGTKTGSTNIEWMDHVNYRASVFYSGNNRTETSWWGNRASAESKPWIPGYVYTLDDNAIIPAIILEKAGPTLFY